jgi:hypothetical protein
MKKHLLVISTVIMAISLVLPFLSCAKNKSENTGSLIFKANGEDFVRQGFIDKNGWHITFDKLFVNLAESTAYLPGSKIQASLPGSYWVDLASGDENADPITVGKISDVASGNYQSLKFSLKQVASGEFAGYSIVMIGRAEKQEETVDFVIKLDEEMDFDGKEGYVGDEIKGLLEPGGTADVEMTFHFDHIFGDIEADKDDHINTGSVGFDFFNQFTQNGKVDVSQANLVNSDGYSILAKAIWTLGHLGEGHCEVANQSSKGKIR